MDAVEFIEKIMTKVSVEIVWLVKVRIYLKVIKSNFLLIDLNL